MIIDFLVCGHVAMVVQVSADFFMPLLPLCIVALSQPNYLLLTGGGAAIESFWCQFGGGIAAMPAVTSRARKASISPC